MSPRTAARRLSALRGFHRFLAREGIRDRRPTEALDGPRRDRLLPGRSARRRSRALIDAAFALPGRKGAVAGAACELLYCSGLRASELVALPASAMREDAPLVVVRGKGGKERLVPISQRARAAGLAAREALKGKPGSRWLFPSHGASGHLTRQSLNNLMREAALAANLDPRA
jgi:integrase/recombinase XerD